MVHQNLIKNRRCNARRFIGLVLAEYLGTLPICSRGSKPSSLSSRPRISRHSGLSGSTSPGLPSGVPGSPFLIVTASFCGGVSSVRSRRQKNEWGHCMACKRPQFSMPPCLVACGMPPSPAAYMREDEDPPVFRMSPSRAASDTGPYLGWRGVKLPAA